VRAEGPLRTSSAEQTRRVGELLGSLLVPGDVVSLSGDLGAGKTELVKGIARALRIAAPITSPTFVILSVRHGTMTLNHFDLYRLDRAEQLEDVDFRGVIESGGVSVIEWGDSFPGELPDDRLDVVMTVVGDEDREIEPTGRGERGTNLERAWRHVLAEEGGAS
jgi:tRNA threonylcarbamoyladenosine biosynthesis protein TsaE